MQGLKAKELLNKYKEGTCSPEEQAWLESWYMTYNTGRSDLTEGEVESVQTEIWQVLNNKQPVVRRINKWWRIAAAAAFIIVCTAAWLWFEDSRQDLPSIQQAGITDPFSEVAPGSDKAILTLADGSQMLLDSMGDKMISQKGATVLQKGGLLQYAAAKEKNTVTYNTLTTPRGGRFQLMLQDGTMVWLNAASSIRYPTVFTEKERTVQVTGEAYFEVAQNSKMPFSVKLDANTTVQVLGTRFNINSYPNEASINTTLLEGSVSVNTGTDKIILKPGEQAQADVNNISVIKDADMASVMAWKNGLFNFNGKNLAQVMRQLERWYDVEVVYESGIPNLRFFGEMDQSLSLNNVLRILEKSKLRFRMERGKRLVVLPL